MQDPVLAKVIHELSLDMDAEERGLLHELVQEAHGDPERLLAMLQDLAGFDWRWRPVDVETFILDPHYLGLRGQVYPRLLEDLVELFEGNYSEGVFTGAIGWGKSTVAEIAMCRMIYEVSCLKNPARAYGLIDGSKIAFINASVNLKQATNVVFHGIKQRLTSSPYFREQFPFDADLTKEMRFPNNIWITPVAGSEGGTVGFNVFGGTLDEVNFWDVVEHSTQARGGKFDQAAQVHMMLLRRMKSRFSRAGKLPGILLTISSSKYPDDFTERRIEEAQHDPTIFVRRYSTWDTKPRHYFSPNTFWLYRGSSAERPMLADTKEAFADKDPALLVEVPEDFRRDFELDIDGATRDLAGYPTLSIKPFIPQREKIMLALQVGTTVGLRHPFSAEETTLQDGVYFIPELLKFDPTLEYFAHADLALTGDGCGLAVGHVRGWKEVVRRNGEGVQFTLRVPIVQVDLMLRVVAPTGGEIQIDDVRALLLEFRQRGCNLRKVTYDQWNSASSVQAFQREGIESETFSVDRPMDAYKAFKEAFLEERLVLYPYEPFLNEVVRLEHNERKSKVDHPARGTKDVCDAVAAVVYHCTMQAERSPGTVVPGETTTASEHPLIREYERLRARKEAMGLEKQLTEDDILFGKLEADLDDGVVPPGAVIFFA